MDIKVRTDRAVRGGQELASYVPYEVVAGLGACAAWVVSALVEISEDRERAARGLPNLRCQLEVWPRDHAPIIVSRLAATGDAAVNGAVADMRQVLERMFRRSEARRRG